jgi:hypothetical protein
VLTHRRGPLCLVEPTLLLLRGRAQAHVLRTLRHNPPVGVLTQRAIEYQRLHDQERLLTPWGCLDARVRAVHEARAAVAARQFGARPALRQALIDLASLAEQCADDLAA